MVPLDSVAGNTLIGMFTRLTLRKPFHVARAAIMCPFSHCLLLLAGAPRPARVAPLAGPRRPAPLRDLPNFSYRHMLTGPVPHSPSRDVKPFALCPDREVP